MFIEIDNVEVAVPQDLVDALNEYNDFEYSEAASKFSDDEYDARVDALVEKCETLTQKYYGHLDQDQQWDVVDQFWAQIIV
jgi:NAD-dependent DNA ligase